MHFEVLDYVVFASYVALIIGAGLWMSRGKKGVEKTSEDYFLASKSLPWWAIGASLIASNISAEQFIGMSGSGFALGLGISTYEWMAAATLIVVGKFFLPIFLEKEIYTMPQFLEKRYDARVRTSMAVFWLMLYVFVNLTSVLHLGALAIKEIMGVDYMYAVFFLAAFAIVYSIYGGLSAVAWTDVIQVVFLVAGGLVTTVLALQAVGGGEVMVGLRKLYDLAPEKFDMIFTEDAIFTEKVREAGEVVTKERSAYDLLPGISVLIGGMWIVNLNYWGCNQYITQRALAAKSLKEAQRGVIFAGFLKILIPVIVVIPGIAAYVLQSEGMVDLNIIKSDEAYPALLHHFVPAGLKGAAFAALVAAIVSSLASMVNSTATIFTMDLYKNYFNKNASEKKLVTTGRIVGFISFAIAIAVAPMLKSLDQAFQYIQEYTGFVSPGVLAIFLFGFFYKKTTANAALLAAIITIPASALLKFVWPGLPFIDRMGVVFVFIVILMFLVTHLELKNKDNPKGLKISKALFKTDPIFNMGAIAILCILAALYALFW